MQTTGISERLNRLPKQDMPSGAAVKEVSAVDYEVVRKDLDKVITLAPDFVYAYYNRANVALC